MALPTPNRSSGPIPIHSSGPILIYGPRELRDEFHMDKKKEEIEPVLAKIEKIYSQVKQDKGRLDSGYCCCVGLLGPTTNIRVNDIIYGDVAAAAAAAAASSSPGKGGDSMAQRSLDGLVTFLTCLFPYLPDAEAVAYLDAADVDPLVAALLIINRRGMRDFGHLSATTVAAVETALRCAAIAAHLPFPHLLVLGWKSLSASLDKLASRLSGPFPDCDALNRVTRLIQIPKADLELLDSWVLATSRLKRLVPLGKELPPVRAAMKRMLLATIHGFYLKAMASLPTNQLTQRYHRSLLFGGYCYGSLHPVENIILNTVWHEQTFPSSKGFETLMISTSCLWLVAARSMYGLISFLCTRYPLLTPDLALQRLLVAGANLTIADPNFFDTPNNEELDWSNSPQIGSGMDTASMQKSAVHEKAARATVPEAYVAAATAAFHPCPPAQQEFLASPGSVRKLKLVSEKLLQGVRDGNQIPGELFHALCMELSGKSYQQREPEPTEIGQSFYLLVSQRLARFWRQHDRVRSNVEAALEEFNKTTASKYMLHVICGVNELVSGPYFSSDPEVRGYNPWTPHKYHHAHVNFLATTFDCYGNPTATLFFAELGNHGPETSCVPVSWPCPFAEQVRCVYCEDAGDRIVHPAKGGRDEFELYTSEPSVYTNDMVIRGRKDRVEGVEDEEIYYRYLVRHDDNSEGFARWKNRTRLPCW